MTDAPFTPAHRETLARLRQGGWCGAESTDALDAALAEIARLQARLTHCEEENATAYARQNNLQKELLDLITLMPDSQTQEILDYIVELRAIRAANRETT